MKRDESGFSLLEATVVGAVMTVLSVVIVQSLRDLSLSHAYARGQLVSAELAERVVRSLERDVRFSVWMFEGGVESSAYLARLATSGVVLAPGARLPQLTESGHFDPDPVGVPETGNLVFLGRSGSTFLADLSVAQDGSDIVRVDRLSFVFYYITRTAAGDLDLGRWGSSQLARYPDIEAITDPLRRTEVLIKLHQDGVRYAWAPGKDAATALFEIQSSGWIAPLSPGAKISEDPAQRVLGFFGVRHAAIADNGAAPGTPIPLYAAAAGTFPGGFEVKLDGPPTGKLLLVRMVVAGLGTGTSRNFVALSRLMHCRDG